MVGMHVRIEDMRQARAMRRNRLQVGRCMALRQ
jgi:hypothetical protein